MEPDCKLRLTFEDLTYSITIRHGKRKGEELTILHSISAACMSSGRLTALMGPSGSGKTSTLDILAGMKLAGRAGGQVLLNGTPRRHTAFRALTCYVMQKDVLVPSATVREALVTSALLKLPAAMAKQQKLQRVDALLQQLELAHVADTFIGDETLGIKGISGGEKRRVSVGVALVNDPAIILLDEPTTGLDSEMALGVMAALKTMAKAGKMVVATIHQPASTICDTFDDWMLLAKGRLLYAGPWADAVSYFHAVGHPCPLYKNPADVFMTLASDEATLLSLAASFLQHSAKTSLALQQQQQQPAAAAAAAADVEAGCPDPGASSSSIQHAAQQRPSGGTGRTCSLASSRTPLCLAAGCSNQQQQQSTSLLHRIGSSSASSNSAPAWWYQVVVLMVRFLRSWWRTPVMVAAETAQYIILSVFMGLLYLRQPPLLPDGPSDRLSALWLSLTLLAFIPSYTALIVWDHERLLLRRESGTHMYSRGAFFVAKSLVTAPVEAIEVTAYAVICYFMFGFQPDAAKFLIWWITLILFTLCSESVGFICALVTPDSKIGVSVLSVILIIALSFSGFLVRNVPPYFAWIGKASYFTYASDILVTNEFSGLTFTDPADPAAAPVPGEDLVPAAMKTGLSMGANMGLLLGFTLGCRLLCWALLEAAARLGLT